MAAVGALDSSRLRQNSLERPLTYSQEAEEEVVSVRCVICGSIRASVRNCTELGCLGVEARACALQRLQGAVQALAVCIPVS